MNRSYLFILMEVTLIELFTFINYKEFYFKSVWRFVNQTKKKKTTPFLKVSHLKLKHASLEWEHHVAIDFVMILNVQLFVRIDRYFDFKDVLTKSEAILLLRSKLQVINISIPHKY